MPKKVVTAKLRAEVRALRDEGWSSSEIAEITGISQRTVIRAYRPPSPKSCAQRGCRQPANPHGRFCVEHSKKLMGRGTGHGPRQTEVLRAVRKHGLVSAEQLRAETGLDSTSLGQVTGNLLKLGLIDRPVRGHYRLAGVKPLPALDERDQDEDERLDYDILETCGRNPRANLARTK